MLKNAKRRIQSLTSMETPSTSTCSSEIFTQSETFEQDEKEQEMRSKYEVFSSTPSDNNLDTFVELHHPVIGFLLKVFSRTIKSSIKLKSVHERCHSQVSQTLGLDQSCCHGLQPLNRLQI